MKLKFSRTDAVPEELYQRYGVPGTTSVSRLNSIIERFRDNTLPLVTDENLRSVIHGDTPGYDLLRGYLSAHTPLLRSFDERWSLYFVEGADFVRTRCPGFEVSPTGSFAQSDYLRRPEGDAYLKSQQQHAAVDDIRLFEGPTPTALLSALGYDEAEHYEIWYSPGSNTYRLSEPRTKEWVFQPDRTGVTRSGGLTLLFKAHGPDLDQSMRFNGWTDLGYGEVRFVPYIAGDPIAKRSLIWLRNDVEIDLEWLIERWCPDQVSPVIPAFNVVCSNGTIDHGKGRVYNRMYPGPRWSFAPLMSDDETNTLLDTFEERSNGMWTMLIIWLVSYLLAGGTKSGQQGKAALAATAVTGAYYAGTQMSSTSDLSAGLATDDCTDTPTTALTDGALSSDVSGATGIGGFLNNATSTIGSTLQSWGPTGTLGVIAGTTALTSSSDYKWLWILGGVALIFLVSK